MIKTLFKLRKEKKMQTDFYVFDTETNGLRAKSDAFIFGAIYGHNFTKVIHSVEDFKTEFLKPRYKGKKVFAHNAEYDLNVIYDNIYALDRKAIFNGKFICATNGNCLFADSMNIYPTSVKKLGSLIGKEKKTLSKGYLDGNLSTQNNVSTKDINYCIRDCEIVFDALFSAFEFSGQIAITQASLSLIYFRRNHLSFHISHNPDKTKHFFKSYYGGRTECFKIGKTNSIVYDVNSMYPFAMRNGKFPNPLLLTSFTVLRPSNPNEIKKFLKILSTFEGCATLTINHKKSWLGFLPVRSNGKLIFPIGTFSGTWNFPEIRNAIEHEIITIKEVKFYTYSKPLKSPFKSFVDHLYNERFKTINEFEIYRIKIYMNSLYGKLAQRILEENIYIDNIDSNDFLDLLEHHQKDGTFIKLQRFNFIRKDAFLTIRSKNKTNLPYSIPSFSSYITSFGRIQLLNKLIECKDNKPVYCDTDSIFMEKEIINNTKPISSEGKPILGAWKLEDKIITKIRGLKNYEYIENDKPKRALKGVPKTAKEIAPNIWEYYNLTKTKESLRRNIESGIQIRRTKHLTEKYEKRIVFSDGNTEPLILDEKD